MPWLKPVATGKKKIAGLIFSMVVALQPTSALAEVFSTEKLLHQCQPLLEGSQSLMGAFQSGQCSSYILGIYDLVSEQCPRLDVNRNEVVLKTLRHLQTLPRHKTPAVLAIDQFLSRQARCLPVASIH
ncbi:hypothetical protein [Oceanospirillum beijerinckii]|uniref:hypothetical protein n=1 Tax=Oceanospirillum beijerinckii TaxID=64976 RepID=UPI00041A82AE|nr:hypothetical protein [Oceanospirillum beijerinckii]